MRSAGRVLTLTLSWGALAFGAVYPWAFWPLLGGCLTAGVLAGRARGRGALRPDEWVVAATLALTGLAISLQLVPLSTGVLKQISPGSDRVLRQLDVGYLFELRHPLSIDPWETGRALIFFAVLSFMLVALARGLTPRRAAALGGGITVLGALLALIGIVQRPFYKGEIYGFWRPEGPGDVFGPFVNKNHFAGWMLMAVPVSIGYLATRVAGSTSGRTGDWRQRLLWWSGPDANRIVLAGFAVIVMALSLVMTFSRSAITAFVLMLFMLAWMSARRIASRARKAIAVVALLSLGAAVFAWTGTDALSARFFRAGWESWTGGRTAAWEAARAIVKDFPWTGSGVNTYGTATLLYQRSGLELHYAQAHNDYLQLAADGGVLVGLPAAIAFATFAAVARRRFAQTRASGIDWLRVGAVCGIVSIAFQELVDFSLQIPANTVLFAVLCAMAIRRPEMK